MEKSNLLKLSLLLMVLSLNALAMVFAQKPGSSAKALKLINSNKMKLGMSLNDEKNMVILNEYEDKSTGIYMVYAQQTYKGIGIYNSIQVMAFKNEALVSATGSRISKMEEKTKKLAALPKQSAGDAVMSAARHLELPVSKPGYALKEVKEEHKFTFGKLGISREEITTQLMWIPVEKGQMKLGWQVQIVPIKGADHWMVRVDAETGEYIAKDNLTVYCNRGPAIHSNDTYVVKHYDNKSPGVKSVDKIVNVSSINSGTYRVIPYPAESPVHAGGAPALRTDPWNLAPAGSNATTLKWNSDGITDYDILRGNNVHAQEDRDNNNTTLGFADLSTTPLPNLTFTAIPDFTQSPLTTDNQRFGITNLFYWNNVIHDITYLYGFDEVAGNFQANNQARGGAGNDYVIADAQDAGGLNNANFSTPPDGFKPRMQMYLFNGPSSQTAFINAPANLAGYMNAVESAFSTNNKLSNLGPLTGDIIYYNDNVAGTSHLGCVVPANVLTGKIALIDRGTCGFTVKVKNAQNAGAIAVMVVNNNPNNSVITMGGADNTIIIPAVMVSLSSGASIKTELANNVTVNVTLKAPIQIDGDLDNGVIVHEFGHGVSNRLTGGPSQSGCLQNAEQMGEGWSDYLALMSTTNWATTLLTDGSKKRSIGSYDLSFTPISGQGFRNFPYSTDMAINPWTYSMLATNTGGQVHNIGEIWCATIWDMTWEMIQQGGINSNLHQPASIGGNSDALKLVIMGMKLQPCSPGFIDGRDAILKADSILFNGKYSCSIWRAFARRGMGANASQGSSASFTDQVADFNTISSAYVVKTANKDSAYTGQTINYTLTVTCRCTPVSNFKLADTIPLNANYKHGGTYNAANRTVTFSNINLVPAEVKHYKFLATVANNAPQFHIDHINEQINSAAVPAGWATSSTTATPFIATAARSNSPSYSIYAQDYNFTTNATFETTGSYAINGIVTLSFWHYFDTEAGWDGGVVEIFADGVWSDLGKYMVSNGYNGRLSSTSVPLQGRRAFTGTSNGTFIKTIVDLSAFGGKTIQLRFRFVSDAIIAGDGWYIDDITLNSHSAVVNRGQLFNAAGVEQNSSIATTLIESKTSYVQKSFDVLKQNDDALITWMKPVYESETDRYIIERSSDGNIFAEIANVENDPAKITGNDYSITDNNTVPGINYYRIKTVNASRDVTYSKTRSLIFDAKMGSVFITPNPAKDNITLTVIGNTKALKLSLVNTSGQQVSQYVLTGQSMRLNISNLPSGLYTINIFRNGIKSNHKVIITK